MRIIAGDATHDVDLTVGDETGGAFGIVADSTGDGMVKVYATGIVTGRSSDGIRVSSGADTLGVDIRVAQVNGGAPRPHPRPSAGRAPGAPSRDSPSR